MLKYWKLALSLGLGLLFAGGCSHAPGARPFVSSMPAFPPAFHAFSGEDPGRGPASILLHFVNAYKPSIAENEPLARNDANGPSQALIRWIDTARKSLDGAFYDIEDQGVTAALLRAQQRGVRVRLLTDNESLLDESGTGPRPVLEQLRGAGIPVVDDNRSGLMHHKFLIIDGTVVWTGSTNITPTSLYQHNNNALSLRSREIVANFQAEFERLFGERTFGPNPPRTVPYPVARLGEATVETYFSPKGGSQEAVIREVQQAKKEISFMTFSLTDTTLRDAILQKGREGVKIRGLFDRCLAGSQYSLFHAFRQAGLDVWRDGNEALLHHKILIVDDVVITGSYNYSKNAETSNNENVLFVRNSQALTRQYRDEFARVYRAARHNRPPQGKCPGADS